MVPVGYEVGAVDVGVGDSDGVGLDVGVGVEFDGWFEPGVAPAVDLVDVVGVADGVGVVEVVGVAPAGLDVVEVVMLPGATVCVAGAYGLWRTTSQVVNPAITTNNATIPPMIIRFLTMYIFRYSWIPDVGIRQADPARE